MAMGSMDFGIGSSSLYQPSQLLSSLNNSWVQFSDLTSENQSSTSHHGKNSTFGLGTNGFFTDSWNSSTNSFNLNNAALSSSLASLTQQQVNKP